jgi:hypothetical protein
MLSILNKIRRTGCLTETISKADEDSVELGRECQRHIAATFGGSLAIRMVDAGSCNGCELPAPRHQSWLLPWVTAR